MKENVKTKCLHGGVNYSDCTRFTQAFERTNNNCTYNNNFRTIKGVKASISSN